MAQRPSSGAAKTPVRCYTRALKNARYLQELEPEHFAQEPSARGFGTGVPLEVLRTLHRISADSPLLTRQPAVAEVLRAHQLPVPQRNARDALFSGTIHFAQVTFQTSSGAFVISTADMNQIVAYASHAIGAISEYASQYGPNTVTVSPTLLTFTANIPSGTYADSDLQGWVNTMAANNGLTSGACIFVVSPPGVSANEVGANSGYHGQANIPYIVAGVFTTGITLADEADVYAMVVSHEIAEMVVDPTVDHVNPEVCDPCDVNCGNLTRCYFDSADAYLGSNQDSPPGGFTFAYYTCGVVQPSAATACPAPAANCQYAPVVGWSELYNNNDNLVTLDVASNSDRRLEVIGINAAGNIWRTAQSTPGQWQAGGWSELYSNNDNLVTLDVARNSDGRLEVIGINAAGNIWRTAQRNGGSW